MRPLCVILFVLSLSVIAYAGEVMQDMEIKNIHVLEIKDGKALIQGIDGTTATVVVGDKIGKEGGKVTEMRSTFITVETGTTRTRMPVAFRVEK